MYAHSKELVELSSNRQQSVDSSQTILRFRSALNDERVMHENYLQFS